MQKIVVVALAVAVASLGCVTGSQQFDPNRAIEVEGDGLARKYRQDGQPLDQSSLLQGLSDFDETRRAARIASGLLAPAFLLSGAGGGMFGWALGSATDPDESVDGALMGAGAGTMVVGFILGFASDTQLAKAIDQHNARIKALPPPPPRSEPPAANPDSLEEIELEVELSPEPTARDEPIVDDSIADDPTAPEEPHQPAEVTDTVPAN